MYSFHVDIHHFVTERVLALESDLISMAPLITPLKLFKHALRSFTESVTEHLQQVLQHFRYLYQKLFKINKRKSIEWLEGWLAFLVFREQIELFVTVKIHLFNYFVSKQLTLKLSSYYGSECAVLPLHKLYIYCLFGENEL